LGDFVIGSFLWLSLLNSVYDVVNICHVTLAQWLIDKVSTASAEDLGSSPDFGIKPDKMPLF